MPQPSDRRVLMVSIRYRMKNRQLCKLYIKYLQFCIRHGRLWAVVLGTRVWRGEGSRKRLGPEAEGLERWKAGNTFCQRLGCPGRREGCSRWCSVIREVPGGEMGRDGATAWWGNAVRTWEIWKLKTVLSSLGRSPVGMIKSCCFHGSVCQVWSFAYWNIYPIRSLRVLPSHFNNSACLRFLQCAFSCSVCEQTIKIAKPMENPFRLQWVSVRLALQSWGVGELPAQSCKSCCGYSEQGLLQLKTNDWAVLLFLVHL